MRASVPLLIALSFVSVSGCVLPKFEHAASTPESSLRDDNLCGQWVPITIGTNGTIEKDNEPVLIGHDPKNKGWTLIGSMRINAKNEMEYEMRRFLVTRIGDDNFISVPTSGDGGIIPNPTARINEGPNSSRKYALGKYSYNAKTERLSVRWVNPIQLKEALERGMLLGTITEEPTERDGKKELKLKAIHVESTTEQLREFLKQYPDMIFNDTIEYLQRVTPKG